MQNKKPWMRANRSPWFPGIMKEAYRQRYTERDTIDWICGLENKIAIMPHLFLQVTSNILHLKRGVKGYFTEDSIFFVSLSGERVYEKKEKEIAIEEEILWLIQNGGN